MAALHHLDFEKPIVELERKIEELNLLAKDGLDIAADVAVLESRVTEMRGEIYSNLTRLADRPGWPGISTAPLPLITSD